MLVLSIITSGNFFSEGKIIYGGNPDLSITLGKRQGTVDVPITITSQEDYDKLTNDINNMPNVVENTIFPKIREYLLEHQNEIQNIYLEKINVSYDLQQNLLEIILITQPDFQNCDTEGCLHYKTSVHPSADQEISIINQIFLSVSVYSKVYVVENLLANLETWTMQRTVTLSDVTKKNLVENKKELSPATNIILNIERLYLSIFDDMVKVKAFSPPDPFNKQILVIDEVSKHAWWNATSSDSINSYTENDSPLKQFKTGVAAEDVVCKEGLQLIIKQVDYFPACVTPETYQKLIDREWGIWQGEMIRKTISIEKSQQIIITNNDSTIGQTFNKALLTINNVTSHTGNIENLPMKKGFITLVIDYSIKNIDNHPYSAHILFEGTVRGDTYPYQLIGGEFDTVLLPHETRNSYVAIQVVKDAKDVVLVIRDPMTQNVIWEVPVDHRLYHGRTTN